MTHVDAFLADIRGHPADDAPRLVFADWLDEAGHADRAAFIRAQCADPRQSCGLSVKRDGAKVVVVGAGCEPPPWLFTAPDTRTLPASAGAVYRFHRGFLDWASFHSVSWLGAGPRVAPLAPAALITLWDREPRRVNLPGGGVQWCWLDDGPIPGRRDPDDSSLVHALLYGRLRGGAGAPHYRRYDTEADARADLSAAALAWALQAPPLTARSICP